MEPSNGLSQLQEAYLLQTALTERTKRRKLYTYYPDEGPLRRELYLKHLEFFAAGALERERLMLAANRVGKTEGVGGYELTLHLTGLYPDWWKGRRFDRAIRAWAAGDTAKTTRDIIQYKLLGQFGQFGTGLVPGDLIDRTTNKAGVSDAVEMVHIKHVSGECSMLNLKSYDQGVEAFQGTEQDVIWLDEEPPIKVYTECLLRTMTCNGMVLCTFTPLLGMSEVVLMFLPSGNPGEKCVVQATWDDVPHLDAKAKKDLWSSIPPYQRDARTKGIPQLGSGAIYPVAESDLICEPFEIPVSWPRVYGMDVGWNRTACLWGAHDTEGDILYLYSEHYRGQAEPSVHADGIRSRGNWIPGVIDPAARGRGQRDGVQLMQVYTDLGLNLVPAENTVESGLFEVWQRMSTGRLKIFKTLQNWLMEFRMYRRDEKGQIVKHNDHLMDAMRYLVTSGLVMEQVSPMFLQFIGKKSRVITDYDPFVKEP